MDRHIGKLVEQLPRPRWAPLCLRFGAERYPSDPLPSRPLTKELARFGEALLHQEIERADSVVELEQSGAVLAREAAIDEAHDTERRSLP